MVDFNKVAKRVVAMSVLPFAWAWVARQEQRILAQGIALDPAQLADARALGVENSTRIRLLCVPRIPLPASPQLRTFLSAFGAIPGEPNALAARYGIFVRRDCWSERRVLLHEFVHTMQFERLGGLRPFLQHYLFECLTSGYAFSALEREAVCSSSNLCA